jgi:hypothetical protein
VITTFCRFNHFFGPVSEEHAGLIIRSPRNCGRRRNRRLRREVRPNCRSAHAPRSIQARLVTHGDSVGPIVTHRSNNLGLPTMIATVLSV